MSAPSQNSSRRNHEKTEKSPQGPAAQALSPGREGNPEAGRDFSSWNREIKQQIDPDTQERVELLTKKQFLELQKKLLKEF